MDHAPLIGTLNVNLSAPSLSPLAFALFSALLKDRNHETRATSEDLKPTPPAIGEYWKGQGGIYGGLRLYPEGMCHVIFAETDVGKHAFGDYGAEVEGTNQIDGRTNTALLIAQEGKHPAAIAAVSYTADGHNDFYLAASGELYHGYLYLPQAFEKAWYVSSSQFSADSAYLMDFALGWLDYTGKGIERLVRPVRRFLQ
ncbi:MULTISPECIES: DUF1566 domain-containing protein [Pseudomonas]|uniref:DUF1566 domain-containing protein n=1 Tax=Pseudomonas guariconensis TaxID=1288410 RepID=UPI002096CFBD|nr:MULTISPECIES: DUF1566 domain-containing protein [Pseudomonas]MCO7595011.1 DUF1566 domain-containing protein [Pseudomonas guariconensis]MCU7221110.1 DUF1566 domain-containing protein [Pseudomonas brassicacearum]